MKIKEIRELSLEELQKRRLELKQESFSLRLQQQGGQIERPSRIREVRREAARVETTITERRPFKV